MTDSGQECYKGLSRQCISTTVRFPVGLLVSDLKFETVAPEVWSACRSLLCQCIRTTIFFRWLLSFPTEAFSNFDSLTRALEVGSVPCSSFPARGFVFSDSGPVFPTPRRCFLTAASAFSILFADCGVARVTADSRTMQGSAMQHPNEARSSYKVFSTTLIANEKIVS